MPRNDFEDFLRQNAKRPEKLDRLSRHTVDTDRWDRQDFDRMIKSQPELSVARQRLADNIAGELGFDEGADAYWLLSKITPQFMEDPEIRIDRLLNKRVNEEMVKLAQYASVRRWTQGDPVASALAFEQMEPDIEVLYDRLQEQMERQQEYEQALAAALAAMGASMSADEMLQQWLENMEPADGADEGEGEGLTADQEAEKAGLEQASADAKAQAEAMAKAAEDALNALERSLEEISDEISERMQEALSKANEHLDTLDSMSRSWGSELGEFMKLDPNIRLKLAKKLNTPKFHEMAKLIGPFSRFAIAENKRKVTVVPEEIVDLTTGDDLPRVIPPEFAKLMTDETEMLFLKNWSEDALVQYEMRGMEKIARGGILYVHDGSSSMSGQREMWAKAVGLALLHVARKQKRSFYGIQFGSVGQIREHDFTDTKKLDPEKVIEFADYFFNGGTDFMTPLTRAMEILQKEHDQFGAVQADIVFATDGQARVTDDWMRKFKELQRKLDFTVWGIAIGVGGRNEIQDEPIKTLCDGKVATLTSLLNAHDLRDVFRGL